MNATIWTEAISGAGLLALPSRGSSRHYPGTLETVQGCAYDSAMSPKRKDREAKPFIAADQQPIGRVIGKRIPPPIGHFPNAETRAAMDANLRYRTRAPKGIFFYENHK